MIIFVEEISADIEDMWVDINYRGKGFGKQLIDKLIQHFEGKGFNNINLCTSAFQAPEFYKKCGFNLEFIRENTKNPNLTKFFFVRFFNNQIQNQGIIIQQN
jgi:ribosomal protein S18 acetylase RimI-like enzyme